MKKLIIALLLSAMLSVSFASCGEKTDAPAPENSGVSDSQDNIADPVSLLDGVWSAYSDEDKFPAAGGDFSEENNKMDAPGKYSLEDTEAADATLGIPAGTAAKIEDAASLVHMMNGNTFTCAAYKVKSDEDVSAVISEIKSNLSSRQWVCGCPDKLLIASTGNYVISAFGENEIMNTFKSKLTSVYSSVKIDADEAIVIE